jgi:hypothetical protein
VASAIEVRLSAMTKHKIKKFYEDVSVKIQWGNIMRDEIDRVAYKTALIPVASTVMKNELHLQNHDEITISPIPRDGA